MSTTPIKQRRTTEGVAPIVVGLRRPSLNWLWWLPILLGALYAVAILTHLRTILDSTWLSSDSDIDGVLAHMGMHAPAGALLTTGDYPHYETMAFTLLTRSFPLYRVIWVLAPVFFAVVGLGAVVWSTLRAFGRWPAGIVGAVLVCFAGGGVATLTAGGLATVFAIDAHANTLITAAVVGAALVWIVPRIAQLSTRQLATAAVVLGVLGGLPLAGDNLYLAWGLAPLVVVTLLAAWRGPEDGAGRVVAFGAGTVAATLLTAIAFGAIMRSEGVRGFAPSYNQFLTFATPDRFFTNFKTLLRVLPSLTAGTFYGHRVDDRSELEVMSAVLVFAGLVSGIWSVRRRVANSMPRAAGGGDVVGERFVQTTFWITVISVGLVVFMIASPNPWTTDGRYLLGPYAGIAALLPLMLERGTGWRLIVTAGASLFVFSALYQFNSGVLKQMPVGYQTAGTAKAVAAYAKTEHVSVGYGNYWNSIDLMWESDFKVDVYPIQRCNTNRRLMCTFSEISISSWDKPQAGVRSMLVVNPKARQIRGRSKQFGAPIASTRIGGLILYVYSYDIAKKLRPEAGLTL
ncbi:MAG TPA: hypothetical protein VHV75_02820 [Solirubrobacteraceae bacterium]|jgi:hypothetical protein|nr:hypothetical protein [Solirubrobacteraceae bacterium]